MKKKNISESEMAALRMARDSILISSIPDKTQKDVFGEPIPGMRVFATLEKMGLLFITEEEPIDIDGTPFQLTPTVEITDEGLEVLEGKTPSIDDPASP